MLEYLNVLFVVGIIDGILGCNDVQFWMNYVYNMDGYHTLCVNPGNMVDVRSLIYSEIPINTFAVNFDLITKESINDGKNELNIFRELIESEIPNFKYCLS